MRSIVTWNINGIRAGIKNGFFDWFYSEQPDILAIQETKAHPDQLNQDILEPEGYTTYWVSANKRGYSGVALLSKEKPLSISQLGIDDFDSEGRMIIAEYKEFILFNGYFPNSQEAGKRLDYKLAYCNAVLERSNEYRTQGKSVIICGDFNIAHKPIDLANPKRNEGNPGYLPEERAWMDSFLSQGYLDAFRIFNQEAGQYTWWSYRFKAREKNIGWRIDYFCISEELKKLVKGVQLLSEVKGSDHCPVKMELQ